MTDQESAASIADRLVDAALADDPRQADTDMLRCTIAEELLNVQRLGVVRRAADLAAEEERKRNELRERNLAWLREHADRYCFGDEP